METKLKKGQIANVGKYSYQYVDIAQIHDYLESINARYIQQIKRIENDDYVMTKRCFDNTWEEEWLQGARVVDATLQGVKNPAQEQGSALTYARRYSLLMAFGLATEDDDAQSLSRNIEVTEEEAKNYTMAFGKHQGKKISELPKDYIDWLVYNNKDERLLKMIEMVTGIVPLSAEEQAETLELTSKIKSLSIQKQVEPDEICSKFGVEDIRELSLDQMRKCIKALEKKEV